MNYRLILFSGVVTAVVGVGLGLVLKTLVESPYKGSGYQHLEQKYMAIGGVSGLLIGMGQESLRQLKQQRDREDGGE